MKPFYSLVVALCFCGCVTSSKKLQDISLGMTKAQVVEILGEPKSVSARSGSELLRYELSGRGAHPFNPNDSRFADGYIVQLADGKVVAFGREDEFRAINVKISQ